MTQSMCGVSRIIATTSEMWGAGDRKYSSERRSVNEASPKAAIRSTDQYLPSIATEAPIPANTAQPRRRVSNESKNHQVVIAQSGVSTVLALNLSACRL